MNPGINANISLIGVPMDLGADRRGVAMGPSAIRCAGVEERLTELGYKVRDLNMSGKLSGLTKSCAIWWPARRRRADFRS